MRTPSRIGSGSGSGSDASAVTLGRLLARLTTLPGSAQARRELGRAADHGLPRWQGWFWSLLLLGLLVVLALRLGAADWHTAFPAVGPNGAVVALPSTFTDVDHPFHIAKELATLRALRGGWLPRWFAFHQGGFPAEFYPTGADLVVVGAYALALGTIPLAVVHKLVVIGVFLLPPLAIWALLRRDGYPLSLALVAGILHLGLPGAWMGGGGTGLLKTGLWPDIFASYLTLFLVLWGADYLRVGSRRGLVLASATGALAIYSNPRSILAVGAAVLAVLILALLEALLRPAGSPARGSAGSSRLRSSSWRGRLHRLARAEAEMTGFWAIMLRAAVFGTVLTLLCAALLVPLHAHQSRYHFTLYTAFNRRHDLFWYYQQAVPRPVILLALAGLPLALLRRGFYTRAMALLLPISFVVVLLAGWYLRHLSIFAQLEGGRLISMLRLPTLFLAALALHEGLRLGLRFARLPAATLLAGATATVLAAGLVASGHSPLPPVQRGLPPLQSTDQPAFTAVADAAYALDRVSTPADRVEVLGDPISTHTAFWIPALSGRDADYGDWLWSWRDYPASHEDRFDDSRTGLDAEWLRTHGITVVLVARTNPNLLALAARASHLVTLDPGTGTGYAIFRVVLPGVDNGWVRPARGTVAGLQVSPERITARLRLDAPGQVTVFVNDFPGWRAEIDGRPAVTQPNADGFIELSAPAGTSTLTLRYTTLPVVWLGRGLTALGVLALLALRFLSPGLARWRRGRTTAHA